MAEWEWVMNYEYSVEEVNRLVEQAKAAEREACAKVAENFELEAIDRDSPCTAIAAAIRSRKDE